MEKRDKEQDTDIHLTSLLFSYHFAHFQELFKLFFVLSFHPIVRLFTDNAEFKGCQSCLQSSRALTLALQPCVSFISNVSFILTDKMKPINQCPGFELDPLGFNLSQPQMLKTVWDCDMLDDMNISISEFGRKVCLVANRLIKLLQHSMCMFTCLLRSHPLPHPPRVFIVTWLFAHIFARNSCQASIVLVFKVMSF